MGTLAGSLGTEPPRSPLRSAAAAAGAGAAAVVAGAAGDAGGGVVFASGDGDAAAAPTAAGDTAAAAAAAAAAGDAVAAAVAAAASGFGLLRSGSSSLCPSGATVTVAVGVVEVTVRVERLRRFNRMSSAAKSCRTRAFFSSSA